MISTLEEAEERIRNIPEFSIPDNQKYIEEIYDGKSTSQDLSMSHNSATIEEILLIRGKILILNIKPNKIFRNKYYNQLKERAKKDKNFFRKLSSQMASPFNDRILMAQKFYEILKEHTGLEFLITNSFNKWYLSKQGEEKTNLSPLMYKKTNFSLQEEDYYKKRLSFNERYRFLDANEFEEKVCGFQREQGYEFILDTKNVKIFKLSDKRKKEIKECPQYVKFLRYFYKGIPDENKLHSIKSFDNGTININYQYKNEYKEKNVEIPIRNYLYLHFDLK